MRPAGILRSSARAATAAGSRRTRQWGRVRPALTEAMHFPGALRAYVRTGRGLLLDCGGPAVAISVLSERLVRVRLAPDGTLAARRSWAVTAPDDSFPGAALDVEETPCGL